MVCAPSHKGFCASLEEMAEPNIPPLTKNIRVSGTLFASHKLPLRGYLAAIAIFCNEVKGKSALALSRDLGLSYKSAFVLLHKLREAMAEELRGRTVGGEGKTGWRIFWRYVRPANIREQRVDRRRHSNMNGKRKPVVIVRERGGNSVPAVFKTEGQAIRFIQARIKPGTIVNADESPARNALHGRFEMKRINHQEAYNLDGACTNWAEEFFSRMRRMEIGHHHHIGGAYLLRYAQEASWREDDRRMSNGEQVNRLAGLAVKRGKTVNCSETGHGEIGAKHSRETTIRLLVGFVREQRNCKGPGCEHLKLCVQLD